MTTMVAAVNRTMDTETVRPRRTLEELVDRLMDALFAANAQEPGPVQGIHEARRLRQTGNIDGALEVLAGIDMARAEPTEARWAFAEWKALALRRFGGRPALLYPQGTGRAAALVRRGDGTLEVAAALGMRWRPGRVVSERSLRGLRPLCGGG